MSMANEDLERPIPSEEKIDEIRRRMAEHQSLPWGKRILRHFNGQYPSYNDRYDLEQRDMGPFEKTNVKVMQKTHFAASHRDVPPFTEEADNGYDRLLANSKYLYISRYVTVRCNPVVFKIIEAAVDNRIEDGQVIEPWYTGLYRQILPPQGTLNRRQQSAIGIYLTDKAGVQFEPIEIGQAFVESLLPETQRDLVEFVAAVPNRDRCTVFR